MSELVTKDDLAQAMSQLATKDDLAQGMIQLRGEMGDMEGRLRGEMGDMEGRLRGEMNQIRDDVTQLRGEVTQLRGEVTQIRGEMKDMEGRLERSIDKAAAHVAKVMMEQIQGLIIIVDEKYKDLPRLHAELRADFDSHAADHRLHARRPAAPARRVRRPPSR